MANVSENRKLVAIHHPFIKQPFVDIFNVIGNFVARYNVINYDKVAITDDGQFIIYGGYVTENADVVSGIAFYSQTGILKKHLSIKTRQMMGKVSSKRNVFIEIHQISMTINQEISAMLGCYDLGGNKLWEFPIAYITPFSENTLNLNENTGQIILKVHFIKEKNMKSRKMQIILDINGKLITKKEGW